MKCSMEMGYSLLLNLDKQLLNADSSVLFVYDNSNANYNLSFEEKDIINNLIKNNKKEEKNIGFVYNFFKEEEPTAIFAVNASDHDNIEQIQKLVKDILKYLYLDNLIIKDILVDISNLSLNKAKLFLKSFIQLNYIQRYSYKHDKNNSIKQVDFYHKQNKDLNKTFTYAVTVSNYMGIAKMFADQPSNICTPQWLALVSYNMAKDKGLTAKLHDHKMIEKIGMNAFLAVAKGSVENPYFIELTYNGKTKNGSYPIVLVGKGITFDSGGISLKPSSNMDEMKYDMCGAAAVICTFFIATELKLPINLKVLVPTCENMPSDKATKPGDIVRTLEGVSVEILNTDAEGRLILCDALSYAQRFKPQVIIDVATLTGACVVALGRNVSAVLGNSHKVISDLICASEQVNDKIWQLPLWPEYGEQLKSNVAHLANIGSKDAGTITAAYFLSKFVKDYPWAHLDIAGTAWTSDKSATGRPIELLVQYLVNLSDKSKNEWG